MTHPQKLFSPLTLPSGKTLTNRIVKASMEENMADDGQLPGDALSSLYKLWASGEPGLILTGNVMVSPDAMTGPGGIYLGKETLDQDDAKSRFEAWSSAAKSEGSMVYMQISHPGRQVYADLGTDVVSASATKVNLKGSAAKYFTESRALSGDEIKLLIERFSDTAAAAEAVGFDGVEIHAAHGYLLAQFLSPLTNKRTDEWGGSLANRARLLIEIIRSVRQKTSECFGVSVKLNSADFQKGGFDIDDAKQVIEWLNAERLDFVELSGGSFESAAMTGAAKTDNSASTLLREIYFIEFAKELYEVATMPLMVTGGITNLKIAQKAIESGNVELIGIARGFGFNPVLPRDWKQGINTVIEMPVIKSTNKTFRSLASMSMTKRNLIAMGVGATPKMKMNPLFTVIKMQIKRKAQSKRYKRWLAQRS